METVEVVVRIPKEKYKLLTEMGDCVLNHNERAIKHGTVLPKGHGALKDTSKILEKAWIYNTDTDSYSAVYTEDIINAPTVIEADRDCEHCSRTYGTLGCCSTVSNKWVYSCEEGHREYEKTHKEADKDGE